VQLKSAYTPDTPPQVLAVLAVLAAVDKQRKATKDTKGAAECGAEGVSLFGCHSTLEFCFLTGTTASAAPGDMQHKWLASSIAYT